MIAIDTNILVNAHRRDSGWHAEAAAAVRILAEGSSAWAIPWPCLHEFLAIVTHPRIFDPPSTIKESLAQVDAWLASPTVALIGESPDHWSRLRESIVRGNIRGPMVHDARIAAICSAHGISLLYTADRDFSRFPSLATHNPLIA